MDEENPLPPWLRQVLIGIGLFLAGAVLAFGYSYRPLHGKLSWQVEQLETRLHERNRENLELSDTLAQQKSIEAERIAPETFAQVERELDQTKRVLRQAEKDLKRAERKRKDANASASKWRKRFEELRDAPQANIAATPPAPPSGTPETPALEMAPAAPASGASPGTEESGIFLPDVGPGPAAP
jgi:hypothetical protein